MFCDLNARTRIVVATSAFIQDKENTCCLHEIVRHVASRRQKVKRVLEKLFVRSSVHIGPGARKNVPQSQYTLNESVRELETEAFSREVLHENSKIATPHRFCKFNIILRCGLFGNSFRRF